MFYYYVINLVIHKAYALRLTSQYSDLIFVEDECFTCDMKSRYYNHELPVNYARVPRKYEYRISNCYTQS